MKSSFELITGIISIIFNLFTLGQMPLGRGSVLLQREGIGPNIRLLSQILPGHVVLEDSDITDGCDGCFLHNLQPNSCRAVQI